MPGGARGAAMGTSLPFPSFTTAADANQTHAQAGTRAGGWAEGVGSSATAVNSLAGICSRTRSQGFASQNERPSCICTAAQ